MAVFSVFAFGTNEKSKSTDNIISEFQKACSSEKIIIEGTDTLGLNFKENIKIAFGNIVSWLNKQDDIRNNINLTGFSRGSVACIHLANYLKTYQRELEKTPNLTDSQQKILKQLQNLDLHIFAIDPVAGLKDKAARNGRVLPDNVKTYTAVLQIDEMRPDFKPQDLTRIIVESPKITKVAMLPMYGNHSDNTKIKNVNMASGAQLTWYALHEFFISHGTRFKNDSQLPAIVTKTGEHANLTENPDARDLLRIFSIHHQERENYRKSGQSIKMLDGIPSPRVPRSMRGQLKFYVKDADFFVNQLERELFKVAYPGTFNYLFEQNVFDIRFPDNTGTQLTQAMLVEELQTLKTDNPQLFARLACRGVTCTEQNAVSINGPRGSAWLDPCNHLQQLFPKLAPQGLKTGADDFARLSRLEMDVYRFTFRYQREKSELSFWTPRKQDHHAKKIRETVHQMVMDKGNNPGKYVKILDWLELQYVRQIKANSDSQLTGLLKDTLKAHHRQYQIKSSLSNKFMVGFLTAPLNLLKELISFTGNLGYIGGMTCYALGKSIENIGRRMNELLGTLGYNPLKYVAAAIAHTIQWTGFALKNSFGLRPLTALITSGIRHVRDEMAIALSTTQINSTEAEEPCPAAEVPALAPAL